MRNNKVPDMPPAHLATTGGDMALAVANLRLALRQYMTACYRQDVPAPEAVRGVQHIALAVIDERISELRQ